MMTQAIFNVRWLATCFFLASFFTAVPALAQTVTFENPTYTTTDTITITWTADRNRTTTRDWIGLYRVGTDDRQFIKWQYIPDGQGSGTVTFPNQVAGQYEARLFVNNGYERVAVSSQVSIKANTTTSTGQYRITDVATSYTNNQVIQANWSAPQPRTTTRDWIGLYRVGTDDRQFIKWQYIPDGQGSGAISFSPPGIGDYELRLFLANGYDRVAQSNRFTVRAVAGESTGSYTLKPNWSTYTTTDTITITWTADRNRTTTRDWIGLYRVGTDDRQFIKWQYIPDGQGSGTVTFPNQVAGQYEARLFVNNGYERVRVSEAFTISVAEEPDVPDTGSAIYRVTLAPTELTVGSSVQASWQVSSGNAGLRDWIGLYRVGTSDRSYLAFKYVSSQTNSQTTFTPAEPGNYEIRYFKDNGYTKVATSNTVKVNTPTVAQCPISNRNAITNYPPPTGPVIAFGDSLTAGVGASTGQSFPEQLARKSGITIINAGRSGDTTRDALNRLDRAVLARDPSVVIVWLGGNDILQRYYERVQDGAENPNLADSVRLLILRLTGKLPDAQGISEAETFTNLRQIIERIQDTGAVVIVVGFSGGVFDSTLEQRYASVANQTGAIYVPNALGGIIGRPALMSDLVHPNNTGYGLVADKVAPYLACTL